MKSHRLAILIMIIVLGTVGATSLQTGRTKAMSQTSEKQSKPLTWILYTLGRDYDCFFTIENGSGKEESSNWLEAVWAERALEKSGLIQELEQLHQAVPNFSYEFDFVNSRIVHIIDARLKQKGYALEGTIRSLEFSGKVHDLPNEIGKHGISIATPTGFFTHEQPDFSTEVEVKGEGLTVRGALSNFVKLEGRDRILWIARTKLERGATTYVYYPWPGRMGK